MFEAETPIADLRGIICEPNQILIIAGETLHSEIHKLIDIDIDIDLFMFI